MEEQIYKCNSEEFVYDDISLANPQGLQGGAYLSKVKFQNKKLVLQTPRCTTKNGIIKTDKKIYCDLMFDSENDEAREFFRQLSDKIKNLIFEKKDIWFHTDMDMDTIDYHWQNILRPYKGSKMLLRCNIRKPHRSKVSLQPSVQIYDEDETLLSIDDVKKGKILMGLLHVSGLRFTSQSFSLDFYLEQAMILKTRVENKKCRIQLAGSYKNTEIEDDSPTNNELDSLGVSEPLVQSNVNRVENDADKFDVSPSPIQESNEILQPLDLLSPAESTEKVVELTEEVVESPEKVMDPNYSKVQLEKDSEKLGNMTSDKNMIVPDQTDIVADNLAETNESLEKTNILSEVTLTIPQTADSLTLKSPNEVYMEIYREVRRRAREARKKAIQAYLEVKRIKSLYMLDEMEIEDSDEDDNILESFEDEVELAQ